MEFALQVRQHPNARYYETLTALARSELHCMLLACGVDATPYEKTLGGSSFLCFETAQLTDRQLRFLCAHSARGLVCTVENGLLRPLDVPEDGFLPPDMPEILKYKGKTNTAFTHLLINIALSASGLAAGDAPVSLLDPLCGRGTTLFCAFTRGMDACGADIDGKELRNGIQFASKYLQYHKIKHQMAASGLTAAGGRNAPSTRFTATKNGERHSLTFLQADAQAIAGFLRGERYDIIVADLPYGVQHAPREGGKDASFLSLLARSLPGWRALLRPGGAMALAFNTYTLDKHLLIQHLEKAGLAPLTDPPYHDFSHWVEQAVNRDVVVARNERLSS